MPLATRVVILGEDDAHVAFARGFVSAFKYPADRVHGIKAPRGRGDAKVFVRQKLVEESRLLAGIQNYQTVKLIVILDGDGMTVEERVRWLGHGSPGGAQAAIIVPCPEIESWIAIIDGTAEVKPSIRRKEAAGQRSYKAGKTLGADCRQGKPPHESMAAFCSAVSDLSTYL